MSVAGSDVFSTAKSPVPTVTLAVENPLYDSLRACDGRPGPRHCRARPREPPGQRDQRQRDVLREVPCHGARGVPPLRGAALPAHRHGRGQLGVVGRPVQRAIRRGQRSTFVLPNLSSSQGPH